MTDPVRWRDDAHPGEAGERELAGLFRQAGRPRLWPRATQEVVFGRIVAQLAPPVSSSRPPWALALAACVALTASGLAGLASRRAALARLQPVQVAAEPGARFELGRSVAGAPIPLEVHEGRLSATRASPGTRVALATPHLRARLDAETFWVQVAGEWTLLELGDGDASVERTDGSFLYLSGRQRIRSDDPRLGAMAPAGPTPTPTAATPAADPLAKCSREPSPTQQAGCYSELAQGTGLTAQNALMALGVLHADELHNGAAALEDWRSYQRRFPGGVLEPDASIAILAELVVERRTHEAIAEADSFLGRFPSNSRAGEVLLTRASLDCAPGGQAARGLASFTSALERAGGSAREEALFGRCTCQQRLGLKDEARRSAADYLREYPGGDHAAALRATLGQ